MTFRYSKYRALSVLELLKRDSSFYLVFLETLGLFVIETLKENEWKYIYNCLIREDLDLDSFIKEIKNIKEQIFKNELDLKEVLERKKILLDIADRDTLNEITRLGVV